MLSCQQATARQPFANSPRRRIWGGPATFGILLFFFDSLILFAARIRLDGSGDRLLLLCARQFDCEMARRLLTFVDDVFRAGLAVNKRPRPITIHPIYFFLI